MRKNWTEDEIEFLKACIEMGWLHKDIANELGRTSSSINNKAKKLELKSQYYWSISEILVLKTCLKDGWSYREVGIELHKNTPCIKEKASSLNLHSNVTNAMFKLKAKDIETRLEDRKLKILDKYINKRTKIRFKCLICNNIWKVAPDNIFKKFDKGSGCPKCAKHGFKDSKLAVTYCIYFKEFDLYKIGVSNNYKIRLGQFGYKPEIIFIREFIFLLLFFFSVFKIEKRNRDVFRISLFL